MNSEFSDGENPAGLCDGVTVAPDEAMAELRRVIGSPEFDASPRNRLFLQLIVESTLEGRRVTGHDVAVRAFGRPASFDPSKDPIVRIECSKLRKALEMYYLKSGSRNPLKLTIPKGRYRAVFQRNGAGGSAGAHIDAGLAVLLRAAFAGWLGQSDGASPAWHDLQEAFPGFPHHAGAKAHLDALRRQDEALHSRVEEGLRRLAEGSASGVRLYQAAV